MSWSARLPAELESNFGLVRIEHRSFFPSGPGALRFLDGVLANAAADAVLAIPSTFAFTVQDVRYAIRDRFGKRAEVAFLALERRFRELAGESGRAGKKAESAAEAVVRRVVGTAPLLNEVVATQTWLDVLDRLAREEAGQTFVCAPFIPANGYAALYPRARAARARFTEKIRERAARHRFEWIDAEPAIDTAEGGRDACMLPDLVHRNELGHDVTLAVVAGRLVHDLRV